jgi:hypothetical protein
MGNIVCCSTIEKVEDSKDSQHQDESVSLGSLAREVSTLTIFPRGT